MDELSEKGDMNIQAKQNKNLAKISTFTKKKCVYLVLTPL